MKVPKNTALILIDVQKGFDESIWGVRNNPNAEKNMAKLLKLWRRTKRPIFHVKNDSTESNSPLRPNLPGNEIKEIVKPKGNEPVIVKNVNSAFIGTDLENKLREKEIQTLVIVGLTTDHCVSTTVRMGGNLGFKCFIVSDATATFSRVGPNGKKYEGDVVHEMALLSLHKEFATVTDTQSLLNNLN